MFLYCWWVMLGMLRHHSPTHCCGFTPVFCFKFWDALENPLNDVQDTRSKFTINHYAFYFCDFGRLSNRCKTILDFQTILLKRIVLNCCEMTKIAKQKGFVSKSEKLQTQRKTMHHNWSLNSAFSFAIIPLFGFFGPFLQILRLTRNFCIGVSTVSTV